jgi:hypothetical protein
MLGGSVLWGYGARDDQTIASLLARKLVERGSDVRVRNLAQLGYVTTQEVVTLAREVQSGYRPDLVIFFDGANDTTAALRDREAGLTYDEVNRRREFNLLRSPPRLARAMVSTLIENSNSSQFARMVRRRLNLRLDLPDPPLSDELRLQLVSEVVRRYEANLAIVKRLGQEFQFQPMFYWQPVIFSKPTKVAFELEAARGFGWAESMFHDVYQAIRASTRLSNDPSFHDLSGLFTESKNLVFIDWCHVTESANASIAVAMADDVMNVLRSSDALQRSP